MPTSITITNKQSLALDICDDPQVTDILYGGGAGSGKSFFVCIWAVLQCRQYPGIRIGLGRKQLTKLKQSTLVTLLAEVHPMFGIRPHEFNYQQQSGQIIYKNGSSIQLVDLAHQPSDPNCDRFGSMLLTHVIVEEVGEVDKKERDVFISRKNRFLNDVYQIVGKSISTCNPSQNYIKQEYYKPYARLGGGEYQKWEYGQVEVNGEMLPAYRAFIRALASDNKYVPRNYIEVLKKMPDPERKRLLDGNWDYEDDDSILFKNTTIDRAMSRTINAGDRFIGVDIADAGNDRTVFSLVEGNMLVDQKELEVDKTAAIGEQIAMEIIKYAQQNGIDILHSNQIGIDVIGVGASTRDFLRSKNWSVKEFVAGGSTMGNYNNLRSEVLYEMSVAMLDGRFKIYEDLSTLETLREQMLAHEYYTEERKIVVQSKNKVKERLGASPDHLESAYIAFWLSRGDTDPKNNPNRIVF